MGQQAVDEIIVAPGSSARVRFTERFQWMRPILHNRKAVIGLIILTVFVLVSLFAPVIAPTNPNRMVGRPHEAPNAEFPLGTTRQGQDVFAQVVHGARVSLFVGFFTGTVIIAIAVLVGVTSGLVGGLVDDVLSLITNVFLIIPGLPLIIVVAGWLNRPGPITIIPVLAFTSWAYGARVLRAQTLTLRQSEFVAAAQATGEPTWRIVLFEILPNMISLVAYSWIGAVLYVILTQAGLEYIGLGDPNTVSWGTVLYWAQNNQALLTRSWWTFVPPGICIALTGLSLVLINYAIDEISNPRLQNNEGD